MLDRLQSPLRSLPPRTIQMLLGAVLMACVGAVGGHYFLNGKAGNPAENPAVVSENPAGEFPAVPPDSETSGDESQLFSDSGAATPDSMPDVLDGPPEFPDARSQDPSAEAESRITAIMRQTEIADEHLRSGNTAQAVRIYRQLREAAEGPVSASLQFRLAFSAEAAGNYAEAIDLYQRMPRSDATRGWPGVAALGEVRCLTALRRYDVLQSEWLRRVILDESSFSSTIRQELMHLLGHSQWQQLSAESTGDLLDDRTLSVPDWRPEPHEILDSLSALLQGESPPAALPELTLLRDAADDPDPNATYLRVHSNPGSVSQLLRAIIRHCRFECEFSAAAAAATDNRRIRIHCGDRSLSLLLDGLTIPFGNLWLWENSRVKVLSASDASSAQTDQFRQQALERLLRTTLLEAPDSLHTAVSRVTLGALLFRHGNPAEASHVFRVQLDSDPRSTSEAATAFNLGKCLMSLRQSQEALQVFLRCIDSSGGAADLKVAGYLYVGRMQIELGHAAQATSSLMRGLALSEETALEPAAAILLASNYLLIQHPQAANSVLMDRREMFDAGLHRDAAAFLSSLARFQAAVLQDRREREARAVVTSLSQFRPEQHFGAHWSLLAAEAADQTGLTAQAVDWYVQTLQRLPAESLRHQALLRLATLYQAEGRLSEAGELLKSLNSAESSHLASLAALRAAELSLEQGNPEEAVSHCRVVLARDTTTEVRRASLRVMGQSFERLKNYQAAVHCFAGMVPDLEQSRLSVPDSTGAAP